MRCVTRHGGHPIEVTEVLKLSNLTHKVTRFVRRILSSVAIEKSVMKFSAASGKELSVPFLASWKELNLGEMVSSHFLSGNRPQTYQRYMQMANVLLQHLNNLNIAENTDRQKK